MVGNYLADCMCEIAKQWGCVAKQAVMRQNPAPPAEKGQASSSRDK